MNYLSRRMEYAEKTAETTIYEDIFKIVDKLAFSLDCIQLYNTKIGVQNGNANFIFS